jgi:hypothetical protein
LNKIEHQSITYKTGTIESSSAILALRIVAGLPIALVAGFIGSIFNSVAVPTLSAGAIPNFLAPLFVTTLFAAAGGMIAWFNRFDSRQGTALLWAISTAGGLLGAFVAYYLGDRYIGPVDLHILNKRLAQMVLIGAAIGANVTAALVAVTASKMGK